MEKMTKRNAYEAIVNYANTGLMEYEVDGEKVEVTPEAIADFAQNEIDLLDKKAAKAKERAAQKRAEGDELTAVIREVLSKDEFEFIADITAKVVEKVGEDATQAKVTYRLGQLAENGEAEKTKIVIPASEGAKKKERTAYKAL